jgi:hypothetical protein
VTRKKGSPEEKMRDSNKEGCKERKKERNGTELKIDRK